MSGFTDYHAHFVYGVDDGAQTREEMYAMLDAAAADGVRHLFATSHSTPGMERFPQEIYDRHLALARAYCTQKGYDLKLEHGSELLYTPATGYAAVQRQLLTLGDTGWVLLEFVPNITAKELETALQEITGAGYRILVAHIERYPCLAQHGLLAYLVDRNGATCTNGEMLSVLWEDKPDTASLHSHLRNLIFDLSHTLEDAGVTGLLIRGRSTLALDTSKVDCDYYNFLRGSRSATNSYRGEYMTQYSWAEVTRSALHQQANVQKTASIPSYYVPPTGF